MKKKHVVAGMICAAAVGGCFFGPTQLKAADSVSGTLQAPGNVIVVPQPGTTPSVSPTPQPTLTPTIEPALLHLFAGRVHDDPIGPNQENIQILAFDIENATKRDVVLEEANVPRDGDMPPEIGVLANVRLLLNNTLAAQIALSNTPVVKFKRDNAPLAVLKPGVTPGQIRMDTAFAEKDWSALVKKQTGFRFENSSLVIRGNGTVTGGPIRWTLRYCANSFDCPP